LRITTTVIGGFPKPDSIHLPGWFDPTLAEGVDPAMPTKTWQQAWDLMGADAEQIQAL